VRPKTAHYPTKASLALRAGASAESSFRHYEPRKHSEDLIRLWIGHSNKSVTDGYVKVSDDEEFRNASAAKAGLGFQLKSLYLFSGVLLDRGIEIQPQVLVV
jgi:hypothetical protein